MRTGTLGPDPALRMLPVSWENKQQGWAVKVKRCEHLLGGGSERSIGGLPQQQGASELPQEVSR